MSCTEIVFDGANDPERCKCRAAVLRTYSALVKDVPENIALQAAKRVYEFHHPEDSKLDQSLTVERWVQAEHFH